MINKVCFASSSGGHLEEISRLYEIRDKYESFLVTEAGGGGNVSFCKNVKTVPQINRKELLFPVKFAYLFIRSWLILKKEKPDCIISTGALATFPICYIGKKMGKKIIYIESFARVDTPSMTGRWMYKMADLFIVQWEDMEQFYPSAVFGGGIF